jgi:hypothetical protein
MPALLSDKWRAHAAQTLKHACRRHGILRWPNRQLFGYQRSVMSVPAANLIINGSLQSADVVADQDFALCLSDGDMDGSEHSHQSGRAATISRR